MEGDVAGGNVARIYMIGFLYTEGLHDELTAQTYLSFDKSLVLRIGREEKRQSKSERRGLSVDLCGYLFFYARDYGRRGS